MANKDKLKIIRRILIILLIILTFTAVFDAIKIIQNKKPFFNLAVVYIKDGGTVVKYGTFYQIIEWHTLSEKIIDKKINSGYLTGKELFVFPHYSYKLFGDNKDFKPKKELNFIVK